VKRSRSAATAAILFFAVWGAATPALAAPPVIERVPVDDTFVDEFLTEACGVPVTSRAVGSLTFKTWDRTGTGPIEMTNVNISITATAGDNRVRFRDVGADLVRRTPDGTLVLMIAGQVPFAHKGVLKINPETGEVLHEPTRTVGTDRVCAALTA
jgi:hypothetical protein